MTRFIVPQLPDEPFMLDEHHPDAINLDGPYSADNFSTDPETNEMLSIPVAGHWHYWRVVSQYGNDLTMLDGLGRIHAYTIVPVPSGEAR